MLELTIQDFLKNAPIAVRNAWNARSGLAHRKAMNTFLLLKDGPQPPGYRAGLKNWARYHRQTA